MSTFAKFLSTHIERINQVLSRHLASLDTNSEDAQLNRAIKYCLLNGGKRVRPLLVYASAYACHEPGPLSDAAAAALECIHTYSLIHDDLPAMDDDELRRGMPSCHIAFDEATAILAGDALQALAFEYLSQALEQGEAATQLQMCQLLAQASGSRGMVAGQSLDLEAVGKTLTLLDLTRVHQLKTGALIKASVVLGALSTNSASEQQIQDLSAYADAIGLAFQIQDDILDVTTDTATLGKRQGADHAHNKPTFVSLLGLDKSREKTQALFDEALDALSSFDYRADYLRELAAYMIKRSH